MKDQMPSLTLKYEASDFTLPLKRRSKDGIAYYLSSEDCEDIADMANEVMRRKVGARLQYADILERALAKAIKEFKNIQLEEAPPKKIADRFIEFVKDLIK